MIVVPTNSPRSDVAYGAKSTEGVVCTWRVPAEPYSAAVQ